MTVLWEVKLEGEWSFLQQFWEGMRTWTQGLEGSGNEKVETAVLGLRYRDGGSPYLREGMRSFGAC